MAQGFYEQPSEARSGESLSTIGSGEEDAWYMGRHDRRFHVMDALWPYPHDEEELDRQDLQHKLLKIIVGSNFFGPVPVVLAKTPQRPVKLVLDVGSGSGLWVQEMAELFPDVDFVGVDLVPTAPSHPPDNAQFECYDIEKNGFRNLAATMDVVHCRFSAGFMRSRSALVDEIVRVLRPGGLAMFGEMEYSVTTVSGRSVAAEAPAFFQWFETLRHAIRTRLALDMATPARLPHILHAKGFRSITTRAYNIPIGGWPSDPTGQRVGEMNRESWLEFVNTTRPLLLEVRRSEQQVDRLLAGVRTLLEDLPEGCRLLSKYHTIWAIWGQSTLVNEQGL